MKLYWNEQLADAFDDGHARRSWFIDLRRQFSDKEADLIEFIESQRPVDGDRVYEEDFVA